MDSLFSNLYYVFILHIYFLFLYLGVVVSGVCAFACFTIYCKQNTENELLQYLDYG